ncbi:hypothetical protein [Hyphococcus sp.]|uniref:hypothetical protein n=1 Tax=Hyphococcus sp. TaxID=2038636 RepID=UPI003D1034D8
MKRPAARKARKTVRAVSALCAIAALAGGAHAAHLEVASDAPAWARFGADALLYLHIGGGAIGLLTGVLAVLSKKGATVHRAAGSVFLAAMFVTYLIGAGVAPFLTEGQRPNFTAGVLALYLLITGWRTARRGDVAAGRAEIFGLFIALAITGMGLLFMQMGAASPTGTVDGSPPQAFILFIVAGSAAVLGELNVILRRGLAGPARIARHLWRMCVSWFIAAGSLFLGQPQVFPDWFNASPMPFALAFIPLIVLIVWLIIVRLIWPRAAARRA